MDQIEVIMFSAHGDERFRLSAEQPRLLIGRDERATARVPDDRRMSRLHAELLLEEGSLVLRNLSRKGTKVGETLLEASQTLVHLSRFQCGETDFLVQILSPPGPEVSQSSGTVAISGELAAAAAALEPNTNAGYDSAGIFHSGHTSVLERRGEGASPSRRLDMLRHAGFRRGRLIFLAVLLVFGGSAWLFAWPSFLAPLLERSPGAVGKALAFAVLTALPCIALFKLLDLNGQVTWLDYIGAWAWGGSVGAGCALILNTSSGLLLSEALGGQPSTVAIVVLAPIGEELFKGLGVLVLFLAIYDTFDNALEGLVLGAATGLGFAFVENVFYNTRFVLEGGDALVLWGGFRAAVTALLGHPVYTAMTGAGFGLCRELRQRSRYLAPCVGLLLACGIHMAWNGAVVVTGIIAAETVTSLLVTTLLFGGAGLALFIAILLLVLARERRVLRDRLAGEIEPGFVTQEEYESFRQLTNRLRYELSGLKMGLEVFQLRRRLRSAQVALAFRKWHLQQGDPARGSAAIDDLILQYRTLIRDVRNALAQLEDPSATKDD